MGVIAKYKFDSSLYTDYLPDFNVQFTGYIVEDINNGDNTITRTISHDTLKPTLMRFGSTAGTITDREKSLLEIIEYDTSNIINMANMFFGCSSLTSLDLSSFNTSQVTNMNAMFFGCKSLISLDLSSFDTSKVTFMNGMFESCSSLTSLNISNFNTSKVTNMTSMFKNCKLLTSLNLSNFNTSSVTGIGEMFNGCSSLISLDLSNFDTSKVTVMNAMFQNCTSLTSLDVSSFNTSNVTYMYDMFKNCSSLFSLDLSSFNTNKVTNMNVMFYYCSSLTTLDISNFNIDNATNMGNVFTNCSSLSSIGLLYSTPTTINSLLSQLGTSITRDIYYLDANPSELTAQDNINYIKYRENKVTANVTLRKVGDVQDTLDLETGVLIQRVGEDGVVLSQQIIKTVDLTIKDQDDKIIQSLHTYPSTTHINLSSDGLIPSAELSYTMYGNIGETTGEKITDGTDSKIIEGKVYGDTLLNVLPSPTLKNSMDYYTSMQKLNNGYDNVNVADGEFKKATLYGQTMINLANIIGYKTDMPKWKQIWLENMLTSNTKYFMKIYGKPTNAQVVLTHTSNLNEDGSYLTQYTTSDTYIFTTPGTMGTYLKLHINDGGTSEIITTEQLEKVGVLIIKYQDDIENQDIPYFEGMQSVVMPSLMTCGKNLFTESLLDKPSKKIIDGEEYFICRGSTTTGSSFIIDRNKIDNKKQVTFSFDVINPNNAKWCNLYIEYSDYQYATVKGVISSDRISITSSAGKTILRIAFTTESGKEVYIKNIQLEYNNEPTIYEPYQSNTLTTPEDVTLRAVGDVRDELDCMTGEYVQRLGERIFVGNDDENWTLRNTFTNTIVFANDNLGLNGFTDYTLSNTKMICDKFICGAYENQDKEFVCMRFTGQGVMVGISSSKLATQNVAGFKQWLTQNPITIQYHLAAESVKTVNLSITNQDNQPQTTLCTFANGYINTSSQGLLPKVDYEVPTSNSYYLDIVKPNTQYTSKSSSDCNATIDGTSYPLSANGTFTTPSTITDNLMVLDTPVNDLMFIEGDLTGRELDYFTGLQSVDKPILYTTGKNLFNSKQIANKLSTYGVTYENGMLYIPKPKPGNSYSQVQLMKGLFKPNTQYTLSMNKEVITEPNADWKIQPFFIYTDGTTSGGYLKEGKSMVSSANKTIDHIKFNNPWNIGGKYAFQLEQGSVATPYEPYQGSILTTNEPIALHKIGDVKDELDLVNECVVRHISKIVLDGSENWLIYNGHFYTYNPIADNSPECMGSWLNGVSNIQQIGVMCDKGVIRINLNNKNDNVQDLKDALSKKPLTLYYQLEAPTTEPVRIVPQNPKQSTTSLTLQSPLQKVGNVADQLRWNPYKGHYVRYNYIQDGVANSTYTFEDLKDMNERKFVNLYNQRTYIDTDHTVQVISHGLSRYCLAEQGKQYQVRWDWVEQPSVDTIKVDLCGNVKEIPSSDNSVIIDVEKFTHQFIQIQGLGLYGKITNLMVIETIDGEIPDVDFFSGIQCVGNTVTIDGNTKVQIDMEQTNGNLFDNPIEIYNNGNNIRFTLDMVRPNKAYTLKYDDRIITKTMKYNQKQFTDGGGQFAIQISNNGSANIHYPIELCYADMAKDGIRQRYYDKESIILPMKLCRVGNIYDNLYYDDLKGYYRIQQSIGHKYFTGETTEVWTMETTNGYRTIKFTCTSANIDQIALGETICNSFKHLSTINDDIEGFIIYNGNFVLRIDKDRLTDKTVDGFKALLASSPIHLFYQLKTPQMINLTEYPNRIEFNTYRDEIFTFFKGMNPTKFTLSVPMDKTYRYEIEEEGQGLANRVTVNNETISAENVVAVKEVRGQGIANIIEDVNNVVITPRPNHGAVATSHTLNNTKPATIRIHGFEPSGDTAIGTYNTTDKAYQLKVMSSNGDNSLSDYYVLNVPYKLETYADGTKDMVYYDEAYKQWHFKGLSVKEYTVASDGTLGEVVEVFKGLTPRSGMIAEFKLMFTSGTTSSRMYYSLNGTTYSYTSLRNMSDGNYLYVGIFNTGGTKIDIAYKTDPNAEYTNLSPLSTQVPECFMVNQIQSCTFCEVTLDKQYIYSEMNAPIELDTYDGSTKVFMDGNATDTNIIIRNECTTKIVNTYTDTEYTVYWKYVDGLGNLRITLGGTTVEVDGKQEYATIKTQLNAPQELLYIGGYNLSIKDLMVVKGAKIDDLPYFEGSRQVGTLVLDEEGNKSYKITLVQGGSVLEQRDEDTIAFKDDNKHNVVVHKIVGVCPTKVD